MNESILTWNVTNWITVVLMAAGGFLIAGLLGQVVQRVTGIKSASWFGGQKAA